MSDPAGRGPERLDSIFAPRSVAVVGTTRVPGTVPYDIFANILRDPDILGAAKDEARSFVEHPPSAADFAKAIEYIKGHWQRRYALVQVG